MNKFKFVITISIFGLLLIPFFSSANCISCPPSVYPAGFSVIEETLHLDQNTVEKGYTVPGFNNELLVGVTANAVLEETDVVLKRINDPYMPLPDGLIKVSDFYEYDIVNKESFDTDRPIYLKVKHNSASMNQKMIMYYDKVKGEWLEIPSKNDSYTNIIRSYIHLPYIRLAVFENDIMSEGIASWYEFKDCMCAASPDYPKGTKLKVTNNCITSDLYGESVIVTINDWGPERDVHPDRVIDLDLLAFKEIANYKWGLVEVTVELVEPAP